MDTRGNANMCLCPAWQPTTIGNVFESTIDQLLDSPLAQDIRRSIIDGTYEYCNENQCPLLINNQLNQWDSVPTSIQDQLADSSKYSMPYEIAFHGDRTCNLSCPSCRTHVIKVPEHELHQQQQLADMVYNNLFARPTDQHINFITSGAGEVFASTLLLSLLSNIKIDDFPNLKLNLHTNALLARARWHRLEHLERNISQVTVSIDAADADVYQIVRRGGIWTDLLDNMHFIKDKKNQLGFELHARMIVQQRNYHQISQFYELCQLFCVDRVEYSRLIDWKSWSRSEFRKNDVFDHEHPERSLAKTHIDQIRDLPGVWLEGDFN